MKSTFIGACLAALAMAAPLAAEAKQPAPAPAGEARAWALPERELMVPVEGGNVWVSVNGDVNAKAAPVVFIHGGPGGTHVGFGGMTALADERAVILYDQLDSGMSDHPNDAKNWRVERFVAELEAIRQKLGVEKWHLVGHSWGSTIALEYSAAHPDRVVSTVLNGTFISTPLWLHGTRLLARKLPEETQKVIGACNGPTPPPVETCKKAEEVFFAHFNGRPDAVARPPEAKLYRERTVGKGFNETLYNAMWGPTEFSSTGTLKTYDGSPLLAQLDGKRVLFMVGQHDEAELGVVQDFVELTPGSELAVVPGGSHSSFAERPVETLGILRGWLARRDLK